MPDNVYDKGYKRILAKKKNFLSLLKNFIGEEWALALAISEDDIALIDKEFVLEDFKERESDIIYSIQWGGKEVIFYCLLELQSTVDYSMPFRLLLYMTALWRRYFGDTDEPIRERAGFRLPAIIPMVLYNGQGEWTAVRSFKEYLSEYESFGSRVVDFEYVFLNVSKYSDEALKDIGDLIASVFLLDKSRTNKQLKNNLVFATDIFTKLTSDEQIDFKDWLKDVLLKKAKGNDKGLVDSAISSIEKGDAAHMTYAIERIFDEVEEKAVRQGREEGRREGRQTGRQEGIGIGRQEGRQEGIGIGWEKGRDETRIEMAKDMLADGESIDRIVKWTKLPLERIRELQE